MRAKIQRWGKSLALRIPKAVAQKAGLTAESQVDIKVVDNQIGIVPLKDSEDESDYRLEDRLALVTDENIHGEIPMSGPVGREVW